jgi:surface polysaccharide O-acyltransferase-like enzyme
VTGGTETAVVERRRELDLMRAAVVVGLVFFHTLRVFDSGDYYVKSSPTSTVADLVVGLAVPWAMPLLFLISGVGTWYSLRSRGAGRFVVERLRRLLVPLVFGVLVLIPIPVWFQLNTAPTYRESYWSFWRSFFQVTYDPAEFPFVVRPGANGLFETGHLWFVVLLLVFSLLLLPLFLWLRSEPGKRVTDGLAAWVDRHPWAVFLPALPVAVAAALLDAEVGLAAWNRWPYGLFFLFGYLLACDPRFPRAMQRARRAALAAGVTALLGTGVLYGVLGNASADADPLVDMDPGARSFRFVFAVAGWLVLVAIIGFASGGSRRGASADTAAATPAPAWRGRAQRYANEAVLPFYVLHQPVIVTIGFFVLGWGLPGIIEYLLISVMALIGTLVLYDLLVRRTPVTRFLFGMKVKRG